MADCYGCDRFKLINSTCGVPKGDEVLRAIWEIFENETGENELAAHVNADRFILFWMDENQENIKQRLEHVIKKIEEIPERLEIPNLFPVFGIFHTIVLDEIEPLYGNAVLAKHQIKGRRDRHYMFYDELNHESIQENRELEEHFEKAIENEEFEIWYQPKYSAHSRKLVGAEALVRWRRADGTLIPPLKFIPLFERNGNIIRLDEYVFRAVCRQQKEWQKQGQKLLPVTGVVTGLGTAAVKTAADFDCCDGVRWRLCPGQRDRILISSGTRPREMGAKTKVFCD